MFDKLNIKKTRVQGKTCLSIVLGLLIGAFPMGLFGEIITFSTIEGYAAGGRLGNHPNWLSNASVTTNSASAKVDLGGLAEAVYSEGEPAKAGDVYTARIDFDFMAANNSGVSSTAEGSIINLSLYGNNAYDDNLMKIGLMRLGSGDYQLKIQETWDSSSENSVPHTGGSLSSEVFEPSSIGVTRDSDLQTSRLRLVIKATRGVGHSEWKITGELLDMADTLVSVVTATGVTFSTSDTIRAGFGSGQDNNGAAVSQRAVYSFEFYREDRSFPFAMPSKAGDGMFLDLNGNNEPDQVELIDSINASLTNIKDSDGDGVSDGGELFAQTDPLDPKSALRAENFPSADVVAGGNLEFTFSSVPKVKYHVEYSSSLDAGSWTTWDTGTPSNVIEANGLSTTVNISLDGVDPEKCFFRVRVVDSEDSDGDGLVDSLERYLGFDPENPNSVRGEASGGDFGQFARLMSGSSVGAGDFGGSTAGIPSEEQTSRFLSQAAFGPNEELIRHVRSYGDNAFEKWIDEQLSIPATLIEPYRAHLAARLDVDQVEINRINEERQQQDPPLANLDRNPNVAYLVVGQRPSQVENITTAWMRQALFAPDRLRQRVAWVLSKILAVNAPSEGNGSSEQYGDAHSVYYDLLLKGAFGTYEELLYQVAVNPLMGRYLSSVFNRYADPETGRMPDENFSREVMQLFSIGLWELNMDGTRKFNGEDPVPTYTNEDVVQLSRVFTGLNYRFQSGLGVARSVEIGQSVLAYHPMEMSESWHDKGDEVSEEVYGFREKRFFEHSEYSPNALPPGQTGLKDIRDAIKMLVNHPSCPPFICKNLIKHMVTSNPSLEYVERVAQVFVDDGNGVRGQLGAVIKAILMDPEARSLHYQLTNQPGRLKASMLRVTSLAKAFRAGEETPALHDLTGIQFFGPGSVERLQALGEYPFRIPSVFSFYSPSYAHPGEIGQAQLVSPEFQIMNAQTSVRMPNMFWDFIDNSFHQYTTHAPDFSIKTADLEYDIQNNMETFLDRLNLLLCHGRLSPGTRAIVRERIEQLPDSDITKRIKLAIYLMITSPDAAVLR